MKTQLLGIALILGFTLVGCEENAFDNDVGEVPVETEAQYDPIDEPIGGTTSPAFPDYDEVEAPSESGTAIDQKPLTPSPNAANTSSDTTELENEPAVEEVEVE